jgi:hypothetical protein
MGFGLDANLGFEATRYQFVAGQVSVLKVHKFALAKCAFKKRGEDEMFFFIHNGKHHVEFLFRVDL